jgi:5-methylcytosine-specific restriction protein A
MVARLMPISPAEHRPFTHKAEKHVAKEQVRLKTAERGYNNRWKRARLGYLAKHPLCVHCKEHGLVTLATDLDHIVPHKGDMIKFWDFANNIQPLCHSCHSKKTVKEDGGFGQKVL